MLTYFRLASQILTRVRVTQLLLGMPPIVYIRQQLIAGRRRVTMMPLQDGVHIAAGLHYITS